MVCIENVFFILSQIIAYYRELRAIAECLIKVVAIGERPFCDVQHTIFCMRVGNSHLYALYSVGSQLHMLCIEQEHVLWGGGYRSQCAGEMIEYEILLYD